MSHFLILSLLVCLLPSCLCALAPPRVVTVTLADGASGYGLLDDHFVSFTSDWWVGKDAWEYGSSILNMDLDSPRLQVAAAALTPAIWRIGGTRADEVWYQMNRFTPEGSIATTTSTTTTSSTSATNATQATSMTTATTTTASSTTQVAATATTTPLDNTTTATPPAAVATPASTLPADLPELVNVTTTPVPPDAVSGGGDDDIGNGTTTTSTVAAFPPTSTNDENNTATTIPGQEGGGQNILPSEAPIMTVVNPTTTAATTTTTNNATTPPSQGGGTRRHLQLSPTAVECHPESFCLTGDRWYEVMQFAHNTGVRIVFCLNYDMGTQTDINVKDTRDGQDWDPTQARQLLEFTKQHAPSPGVIYGFELGNEVTHKGRIRNLGRYGRGFAALRGLLDEIWADTPARERPLLLGPATTSGTLEEIMPYVQEHIDIVTFHKYQGSGRDSNLLDKASDPGFYWSPDKYSDYVVAAGPRASRVWLGEGAMASNSGQEGVTDTFLSTLWFTNALASVAQTKPIPISTWCRQTLVGGHYGVLAQGTLDPLPDFYLMRLWTHIVGNQAVGPLETHSQSSSSHENLMLHSFCGKNKAEVVLIAINIYSNINFELDIPWGNSRKEYLLHGTPSVRGQTVLINGMRQSMGPDGSLPEIVPNIMSGDSRMKVPAQTVVFAVVKDTSVGVCGGSPSLNPFKGLGGGSSSDFSVAGLSPAALGGIIVAALVVIGLACYAGLYCGQEPRIVRKRNAHSVLAQHDDGLMLNMNIQLDNEDDGLYHL